MFPRPYLDNSNLDFSFSGLKTAVAHHLESRPELRFKHMPGEADGQPGLMDNPELAEICASFNWAVADTLRVKVERALKRTPGVRALVAAGGVAANGMIRETLTLLAEEHGIDMILPESWLCTDNGAMVAMAGEVLHKAGLRHGMDLDAVPRGRQVPWDYRRMEPEVPA
jgi:N6-L-threonylcarbamoyladenine synthase